MILVHILFFVIGIVLLVKGSDFLVKSAASISKKMGISEFVIGLTIVAIGTSIPELASSIVASIEHQNGIVLGTVIGSNIANIGLIIGLIASLFIIKTRKEMIERDGYIMLFASVLFLIMILDGTLSMIESALFLLFYFAYILFLFWGKSHLREKQDFKEFINYFFKFRYMKVIQYKMMAQTYKRNRKKVNSSGQMEILVLFKDVLILLISGVAVVLGANYLVRETVFFSDSFLIPEIIVSISLIAISTSLPELAVSISAARKGYSNIAVGNIIGSNIANIFLISGVSGMISPLHISESALLYFTPFMIFMSILLLVFIRVDWKIKRIEGAVLLFLYLLFMLSLFFIERYVGYSLLA